MKHRLFVSALLFLALISSGIMPFHAQAQSYADGTMVGQDEYYDWLQSSNRTIRKRVSKLDDEPVKNIPIPILFGVAPLDLSPNFGDPRSGGRTHEGEDMMAPKGAPVISPTEAVVLDTGVWAGGGNYVSTANPGGEKFVYMHLDWIADLSPGEMLEPGDLIGYVGNTGNASGGAYHLHFEIRKNGATDPFPRLRAEFSLAQKIGFLENIIDDGESKNEGKFVQFLVANYKSQFLAAQTMGIDLPKEIAAEMLHPTVATVVVPAASPAVAVVTGKSVAKPVSFSSDLELGARGSAVIALQKFLIAQNKGPAARALVNAGATGNFGKITQSALIEYQKMANITPAAGYFGPKTRAYAAAALKQS